MKFSKRFLILVMAILVFTIFSVNTYALTIKTPALELSGKSAILMDAVTGTVLYEKNADDKLAPASVTKIMSLLLIFEALDEGKLAYDEIVTVSENAASMGGSQIFLEPGEQMSVEELLKSVIVASANDAIVALAEHTFGSEEAFVQAMNEKAVVLEMQNTSFENATGLDDDTTNHLTSARDIAIMSKELLKHKRVMEFTTIWMDTIRNGDFGLTNTNRLVRFYKGITGLKTGYTSGAGYCISATAKRGETHLIAVIMGAESSDARNTSVAKLLDFGFANYSLYKSDSSKIGKISVYGGKNDFVEIESYEFEVLLNKGYDGKIQYKVELDEYIEAPVSKGDVVGRVIYSIDGENVGTSDIVCSDNVAKIGFWEYTGLIIKKLLLK